MGVTLTAPGMAVTPGWLAWLPTLMAIPPTCFWIKIPLACTLGTSMVCFYRAMQAHPGHAPVGTLGRLQVTALGYAAGDNYTVLYAATAGGDPGVESNSMFPATRVANSSRARSTNTRNALLDKQVYLPLVLQRWPTPQNNLVEAGIYRLVQR